MAIRPHFGFGNKGSFYYGARVLLNANQTKKYGLEITKFYTKDDDFLTAGIVLEQRLYKWFNMSIGTVGYFNYGKNGENIVGVTTNLGWEPENRIPFKPFVTFRTDIIFAKEGVDSLYSINLGFGF